MAGAGRTILVIDDDPDVHDAVRLILESEGYRVEGAVAARAGLDVARRSRPAAILLDIMMDTPVEGFEVAKAVHSDPALAATPLVFISSIGEAAWREQAAEVGLVLTGRELFVEKPFDAAGLLRVVRAAWSNPTAPD